MDKVDISYTIHINVNDRLEELQSKGCEIMSVNYLQKGNDVHIIYRHPKTRLIDKIVKYINHITK